MVLRNMDGLVLGCSVCGMELATDWCAHCGEALCPYCDCCCGLDDEQIEDDDIEETEADVEELMEDPW